MSHFGSILVTLWRPLGSLWGPFVVNFAPEWHPCRSLRPLVVSFGLLFGSFGYFGRIFRRFCCIFHGFKAYVPLFPWILSVFCFVWRYWRYPQFFLNDFKRAERASERSEPRAKLFVESATRGSHCIFLPRMARQTFQIIDVNPCSREGLFLTRFPFPC